MKNPETGKRFVALSAAVAIGLGGVALTGPAIAANEAPKNLRVAAVEAFQTEGNSNIAAVGYNSNGDVAVQVVEGSGLDANAKVLEPLAAFAEADSGKDLQVTEISDSYQAINATDVVGGAGYAVDVGGGKYGLCSFGFPATSADGDEAIITAGHCSEEGNDVLLERPSTSEAHAGEGSQFDLLTGDPIGTVTHSQFGPLTQGEVPEDARDIPKDQAQDFAVITVNDESIETHGEVTDWRTAGDEDLFASTLDVNGVTDVTVKNIGNSIVRSGRTSGMHEGTVGDLVDGYSFVRDNSGDVFVVHGFATETLGLQGDSGGSVMIGDQAAGVASASNMDDFVWVAELHEGLKHLPKDYEIKTAGDDEEPSPTPTATEDPTQEPTETPDPTPTATEDPTQEPTDTPEPTPTATETGEPTETPEPTPTDTDSPEPTPTETDTAEPTNSPEPTETATDEPTTPAPTPSETEEADEDAELTVDPREIAAEQFLAEDEEQAIEQDRGVTYSVTGVEPGSDVTFDTYASTDSASANAGSEEAPAEDSNDAPAKSVTVTADEDGNASSRVWGLPTAPAEAYIGDYEVIVTAEGEMLESSFEVVGEGGGDGGQDDGDNGEGGDDLPRTGSTTAPLAAGAAGLVALGGALVYVARRRKA